MYYSTVLPVMTSCGVFPPGVYRLSWTDTSVIGSDYKGDTQEILINSDSTGSNMEKFDKIGRMLHDVG